MGLTDSSLYRLGHRRKQLIFCVSVKVWRHSHLLNWVTFFKDPKDFGVQLWGQSGTLLKGQGSCELDISLRDIKGLSQTYVHPDRKESKTLPILF